MTNDDKGGNSATTTAVQRTVMLGEDFQVLSRNWSSITIKL